MSTLSFEDASEDFDPTEPRDLVQLFRDGSFTDELSDEDAVAECPKCGLLFLDTDEANSHVDQRGHVVRWVH